MENGTGGNFFRSRPKKYGTGTNMKRNRWIIGWVAVLLSVLGMEKGWAIDVKTAEELKNALGSNAVLNGNVVTLTGDVNLDSNSGGLKIVDGTMTLDLGGKTLTYDRSSISAPSSKDIAIEVNGTNACIVVKNGKIMVKAAKGEDASVIGSGGDGSNAFAIILNAGEVSVIDVNLTAVPGSGGKGALFGSDGSAGSAWVIDANGIYTLGDMLPYGTYFSVPQNINYEEAGGGINQQNATISLVTYNVNYNPNGGTITTPGIITYNIETTGFTLPAIEKAGYKFNGWKYESSLVDPNNLPATSSRETEQTVEFIADWTPIPYKITYDVQGGKAIPDSTYTIEQGISELPIPEREGFVFDGWYRDDVLVTSVPKGTGDVTLLARWEAITYTLSFVTNNGTTIEPIVYTYTNANTVSLPADLTKAHYTFDGWYDENGTKLESVPLSSKDNQTKIEVTIYAQWTPVEYTIAFNTNGGTSLPSKIYTIETDTFKLPTRSTKTGYTFVGWYKDEALTEPFGTEVPQGTTGDFTLYAKWELAQYKIEYDTYHGTNPADAPTSYTIEDKVILPTPTRSAFTFAGWHQSELLDDEAQTYIAEGTTGNKTFYAEWSAGNVLKIIRPEGGTITVKAGATELQSGDRVGIGTMLTVTATPASSDYAFSELIINGTSYTTVPQTVQMPADGGLTVSARFADLRPAATVSIYFDLPAGVTATNPAGGEVVEAVTSGETLEFRLSVDAAYFESVDAMQVLANGTPIEADADGIYRLEDCTSDVIVSVTGLVGATHEIVLLPSLNGVVAFDGDDGTETSRTVSHGEEVSIVALPDAGYRFEAWADGETANPRTFTALSDRSFEACFVEETTAYSIILPELAGVTVRPLTGYSTEVKPGGKFKFYLRMDADYDQSVPVVYANDEKLEVVQEVYSLYNISENIRISVDGIVRNKETLTLQTAVSAVDLGTGLEVANQEIQSDAMVLLHAQAPEGKCFSEWNDGLADNPRMVRAADAPQMFPLFQPSVVSEALKVDLPVLAGAALTPVDANADAVLKDDSVRLKLVILPAYSQSEVKVWANGKELASALSLRASSETRTLFYTLPAMTTDVTVEVTGLERNEYDVLVQQQEGGTVSASQTGKVKHGTVITLQATPQAGNMFMKWQDGNTLNPYPYVVTGDCTLSGRFIATDKPVGNERIPASSVSIQCLNHTLYLYLSEAAPLWIWNVEGKLVKNVLAPSGHSTYPLPDGVYVVRVGTQSPVKVVVR